MNKYLQALEKIKNEYDAYYFENKYGDETHKQEFDLINSILPEKSKGSLSWIKNCYDCYYKDELNENSAFAYLEQVIEEEMKDE